MSDPRDERGLDGQLPSEPEPSQNGSHHPVGRRANPVAVIPSASTRSGSGVRGRPHGALRDLGSPTPGATPRPKSQRRPRQSQSWQPPKLTFPTLHRPTLHRPTFHRPTLHRPTWPLSILQTFFTFIALATVGAVVAGLVLLIPNRPVTSPGTGSVREVDFRVASKPPTGAFYYGPYFVSQGSEIFMMGSDGKTSSVWSSTDGSTWQSIADPGSFGAPNLRFVVLGFASDGNGGLVAVGDGFVAGKKVAATAWHSRDGRTWTSSNVDFTDNSEMIGLAMAPGAMVSAGNGVAWYSGDGSNWNVEALPNATGYIPRAVRAWANGFALVAVSSGSDTRHTKAWISSDGKTWNEAASELAGFQAQDLVAYGNGLVAVGSQILTPDELATPSPSPSPTPTPGPTTAKGKATPKPTPTPKPTKTPAPSARPSGASPSPSPTLPPSAEVATSWISPDGFHWYRGNALPPTDSQDFESVTQVFDSLVAVSSEPGGLPGASASSLKPASLWTSDDGITWKPMTTNASALTRGRLTPFGVTLVLAGVNAGGSLAVLTGSVKLGSPLPLIAATPTPPFSIALTTGVSPIVPGLTADSTLGPVIATTDQFLAFVSGANGTAVFSSADGKLWAAEASPDALAGAASIGSPGATIAVATPTLSTASGSPAATTTPKASAVASGSPAASAGSGPPEAGVAVVTAAALDSQGGVVAVGSLTTAAGQSAAIWRLSGNTWSTASISVTPPTTLGSVAVHGGDFVAAASSPDGPRLLYSGDGATWVAANINGAAAYSLTVSTSAAGFVASGVDATGKAAAWTSSDGLTWVGAGWKLPANTSAVYATRRGLVATSQGVTGNTSWWWSTDGAAWHDSKLTTTGGCWATLDSGFAAVSASSSGATASANPKPSGSSVAPWSIWASADARVWQRPIANTFSFAGSTTCQMAALHSQVVIVGWSKSGVLTDFYGELTGL